MITLLQHQHRARLASKINVALGPGLGSN